jgi:transcriptional regulator with XRE-family HTH domain
VRNELINIGSAIKKRRELLGLLQPQLASISGVSTRTIQLVEMGKGNPSLDTLIKIADPLGLQINLSLKEAGKSDSDQP